MHYTGIGSRDTPPKVINRMTNIALILGKNNWVLRSGGARGADTAFEIPEMASEIYLPWRQFENHPSPLYNISSEALKLAATFHPAWHRCSNGARKLHARNGYQILGVGLKTPSKFVICWTPNGASTGGTGQAIRIAQHFKIPVFDMYNTSDTNILDYAQVTAETQPND